MPARRILFLDASRLSAFCWKAGHVVAEDGFAPDATGLEAFAGYLKRHRGSLFYLLADVPEEGFQIEEIPYVQGADRTQILKRKLAQYFYGSPYSTAVSLGRQKEGRRDEKILFAALTRPQHFEPWVTTLHECQSQLVGIYSLPLLLPTLTAALAGNGDTTFLLITFTRAGLRQSLFDKGQLRFSRLTPLATDSTEEMAVSCAVETSKIYQYLAGQRLIARGAPLAVKILAHPTQTQLLQDQYRDTGELRLQFLDLMAEGNRIGLKSFPSDSHAELLFMHLLARNTPSQQMAPEDSRHHYRVWQIKTAIKATSVIIFAGCALFAARQGLESFRLGQQTDVIREQATANTQSYNAVLGTLPKIPISTDNLRALIGRYNALRQRDGGPAPMLIALSRALDESPRIEVTALDWTLSASADSSPAGLGKGSPASGPASSGAGPYAVADFYGQLPIAMASDMRGQIDSVNAFVERLKTDTTLQVKVLNMPIDTQSGTSLKGGSDISAKVEAPKFTLRISRKL
ncbi:MAG: hypothetical protein EG825_06260 [Rhodocyclaceae bacterium]|nr:hypothetical protein [Rhodocyclaceae bacterium]